MNKSTFLTLLLCIFIPFCSCSHYDDILKESNPFVEITQPSEMDCPESSTTELNFISHASWTATITTGSEWLDISSSNGDGDEKNMQTIVLSALSDNNTNADRVANVNITSGSISKDVEIIQHPAFILDKTQFVIKAEGGSVDISIKTNATPEEIGFSFYNSDLDDFEQMFPYFFEASKAKTRGMDDMVLSLPVAKNDSKKELVGRMVLVNKSNMVESVDVLVIQEGNNASQEIDSKNDGIVRTIQAHSKGAGIPVVIMGDGFQNSDVEDGTYDKVMSEAMKYFFSIEPMTTHQDYFDVYSVSALSENMYFGSSKTAFSCKFSGGSRIEGDNDKCIEYAKKAIGEDRMDDAVIIVVLNSSRYSGTCYLYSYDEESDFPKGFSVAFVTMVDPNDPKYGGVGFEDLVHHEAVGHGFGKLADEYYVDENDLLSEDELEYLIQSHSLSLFPNVDIFDDVTKTLWSRLAADPLYSNEGLGAYEGAFTYQRGVYRPTISSVMNRSKGLFNAPSREAIYKRIMYIANKHAYKYKYDDFIKYDAVNRSQKSRVSSGQTEKTSLPPLPPPRLIFLSR